MTPDRKYVTCEIVGIRLLRCSGATRNGRTNDRPEICPTRLVLPRQTLSEGRLLRDLGEQKWQGTKGSQDFHRSFLTILNYLVRQDNPGIKLYYESGTRRVEHAKRPVIVPNDTLARGPRTRLDALDGWMEQLQAHYGTPETYSPDQSQRIVNWVATIITRDPVMTRMLVES